MPTKFQKRVYKITKRIPRGKVSTYKELSRVLKTKAYRAVGTALNKNSHKSVPCHRVVNSNGNIGGFASGTKNKIKILKSERITFLNKNTIELKKHMHKF